MMQRVDLGTILGRTGKLIGEDIVLALVLLALFAGFGTQADVSGRNLNTVLGVTGIITQYYLIKNLCVRHGLVGEAGPGGIWAFVGLDILAGLGVLLGLVLLVLPGLYLAARWSIGGVALIAERRSVGDALGESWRLTADHAVAIALSILVLFIPAIAGLAIAFWLSNDAGNLTLFPSLTSNLLLFGSTIGGWYLGVAVYSLVTSDDNAALARIFD